MKVGSKRLSSQLVESGFRAAYVNESTQGYIFERPSHLEGLFERIEVESSGKRGEAIWANIGVSVVRGPVAVKGLIKLELLSEIAAEPDRGWTIVETDAEARLWEHQVVEAAPSRVALLAERSGPLLLEETMDVRKAASRYISRLGKWRNARLAEAALLMMANGEQRDRASAIAAFPGVVRVSAYRRLYSVAALCIIVLHKEVGEVGLDTEASPIEHRVLMWQIQILVDRLSETWPTESP